VEGRRLGLVHRGRRRKALEEVKEARPKQELTFYPGNRGEGFFFSPQWVGPQRGNYIKLTAPGHPRLVRLVELSKSTTMCKTVYAT